MTYAFQCQLVTWHTLAYSNLVRMSINLAHPVYIYIYSCILVYAGYWGYTYTYMWQKFFYQVLSTGGAHNEIYMYKYIYIYTYICIASLLNYYNIYSLTIHCQSIAFWGAWGYLQGLRKEHIAPCRWNIHIHIYIYIYTCTMSHLLH